MSPDVEAAGSGSLPYVVHACRVLDARQLLGERDMPTVRLVGGNGRWTVLKPLEAPAEGSPWTANSGNAGAQLMGAAGFEPAEDCRPECSFRVEGALRRVSAASAEQPPGCQGRPVAISRSLVGSPRGDLRRTNQVALVEAREHPLGRSLSIGLRNRRSQVRILSGALLDSADRDHLQVLRPWALRSRFVARKLVSDFGRFSGDFFGDLETAADDLGGTSSSGQRTPYGRLGSNRGHHDFQTDAPSTRTQPESPANERVLERGLRRDVSRK
jgi:hypothetical protein